MIQRFLYIISYLLINILYDIHYIYANTELSPYYQHLPNCDLKYNNITKKTKAKAILCPMIKYIDIYIIILFYTCHHNELYSIIIGMNKDFYLNG